MTNRIKLAIFDLDGTLVNSVYDLADATNRALADLGLPTFETERYYHFVGNGTRKLCERVLPEELRTDENIDHLHAMFAENYERCCFDKTEPYGGISKLLFELRGRGVKCAVASNKPDGFSCRIVEHYFGDTFDFVVGKREGTPTKPDPAIINYIMTALDASPEETVIIGDSDVDIITARNSGTASIGCVWGFRGEEELTAAGCTHLAREPLDILAFIDEMNRTEN
ncbi:MAG: HAD family hydrolase [Ruminococcus sp.]|nr:HAD family hydrolase [Ruminococcus sp.]